MNMNGTAPEARGATSDQPSPYDVVVVGGGTAGLGAALALVRARRSVLVLDAGTPRNAPAAHVHNYLGREATPPADLLATGRAEVAGYGGEVVTDRVTAIAAVAGGGFRVERLAGPPVHARRLLVTTGLVDELPAVKGLAARWGTDVIHCPYCHGWEVRDQAIVILATSPMAVHQALLWRQWTAHLTLVLHDCADLAPNDADTLAARGIALMRGPAAEIEVAQDRISGVRLANGRFVACQAVVLAPRFAARADMLASLGLTPADYVLGGHTLGTHVAAGAAGATTVPGVWVAGNVTDPTESVIGGAAAGLRSAHAINLSLIAEDTEAAVAAGRVALLTPEA